MRSRLALTRRLASPFFERVCNRTSPHEHKTVFDCFLRGSGGSEKTSQIRFRFRSPALNSRTWNGEKAGGR